MHYARTGHSIKTYNDSVFFLGRPSFGLGGFGLSAVLSFTVN